MASSSSTSGQLEENGRTKNLEAAAAATPKKFPQFDVVTDDSDHKYAAAKERIATGSGSYKAILKDWKILQENLPESIYVRVYESRMELMRAVIIGPPGTPYHDGLFFFDIFLPPEYPAVPPKVLYWSFGFRLNPNLYSNGLVCLSLLNTWNGKGNEMWVPGTSTILQLLVSIEGLVLNEMPYFNEPGIKPKYKNDPSDYNESAFVLSCKTMMCLLRSPLRNFEGFINDHFRDRSRNILSSCQAYMNGFLVVGQYREGHVFLEKPVKVKESLRKPLELCYNGFVKAFEKDDPSVGEFLELLKRLVETTKGEYERKKKEKRDKTVIGRAMNKVKKIVTNICGAGHGE